MSVTYYRIRFKPRTVQYPRSYTEQSNAGGGVTHTPSPGNVIEPGVLPTVENLNTMDKGIYDCAVAINSLESSLIALRNDVTGMTGRINSALNRISTNENRISNLTITVNSMQSSINSIWGQISYINNQIAQIKARIGM